MPATGTSSGTSCCQIRFSFIIKILVGLVALCTVIRFSPELSRLWEPCPVADPQLTKRIEHAPVHTTSPARLQQPIDNTPRNGTRIYTTLIMFVTVGVEGTEDWRILNNNWFLSYGLLPNVPEYYFLFIVNGCHEWKLAPHIAAYTNFELYERENLCMDAGAWDDGILYMESKGRKFERFIMLNSSVRGPFIPTYMHHQEFDWVAAFTSRLSNTVRLVGTSVNCYSGVGNQLHLQSMTLATDSVGMECCIRPVMQDPVCDVNHPMTKDDVIKAREVRFTQKVLEAGYSVASLMVGWHRIDINRNNEQDVINRCLDLSNLAKDSNVDPYLPNAISRQGLDLHPLEMLFFKTNRDITPALLNKYTLWETDPNMPAPLLKKVRFGKSPCVKNG